MQISIFVEMIYKIIVLILIIITKPEKKALELIFTYNIYQYKVKDKDYEIYNISYL